MKSLLLTSMLLATAAHAGISDEQAHRAIDRVLRVYAPILKEKGTNLQVVRKFADPTVNAYTSKVGNDLHVSIFGGLIRYPSMSEDGLSLVVCKEIGNFIGGAPRHEGKAVSVNGQADYFTTLKCLRKTFRHEDNIALIKNLAVPEVVSRACAKSFGNAQEAALCVRSAMAGKDVVNMFVGLRKEPHGVSFETPDQSEVKATNPNHPASQCRLDTYFQGALCNVNGDEDVSDHDDVTGTCHSSLGYKMGNRPACWYKSF